MKEQILSAVLPELPIVGTLRLTSRDGKSLRSVDVVKKQRATVNHPFFQNCFEEFEAFLQGDKKSIKLKLDVSELSPFQFKVLEEMARVPYGHTATYKDLAQGLGSRAYQAIGSACGKNPFLLIYPCHRIIGSRDLGGFAHGLKMKAELLRLESQVRARARA